MEWGSSVDIWNVAILVGVLQRIPLHIANAAVQIWDLFENRHLFKAEDENGELTGTHHIVEMVSYLGLPPLEYIQRSDVTQKVFDAQAK
jgi:hypothetical protein